MNETLTFSAALLLGLVGSTHCLGMCGPLAALTGWHKGRTSKWSVMLHNAGRLLSYALFGALAGWVGYRLLSHAAGPWLGLVSRGFLGAVLVMIGIQVLRPQWRGNPLNGLTRLMGQSLWQRVQPLTQRLQGMPMPLTALVRGMLWGWLPCGLVYSMLVMAAAAGGASAGALVMLGFGLGTMPAMLGVGLLGDQIKRLNPARMRPWLGAALVAGGLVVAVMPTLHSGGGDPAAHAHHPNHR